MKWFSNFIKIRRQNDYVKIMLVVFLLGIWMIGSSIYNGVKIYGQLWEPTEYIISGSGEKIGNEEIENIEQISGIDGASLQKTTELTIKDLSEEAMYECYNVSKTYLETVYHVNGTGAMKTFYVTPKLYERLEENTKGSQDNIQLNYQIGEDEQGTARFVKIESNLFSDEEEVFAVANSVDFDEECSEIRVYITEKDLDGTLKRNIESLGYTIENQEVLLEADNELNIGLMRIKYDIGIGVLCLVIVAFYGYCYWEYLSSSIE